MKKRSLLAAIILISIMAFSTTVLADEAIGDSIFFTGVEVYNDDINGLIKDPAWTGLVLSLYPFDIGLKLGAAANLKYNQFPEKVDYSVLASVNILKLFGFVAVLDFNGSLFLQNTGYGNEIGWSANAKLGIAMTSLEIRSGSVRENYDGDPFKLMLKDDYFYNTTNDPKNIWWVNGTLAIQSSKTRRDSLFYGFTGSHEENVVGRHDVGYNMKFSPADTGVSIDVYTGFAVSAGLSLTFINRISLSFFTSNYSGAEIYMTTQNGAGGQAMWASATGWLVIDDFGTIKATFSTPIGNSTWSNDLLYSLYQPVDRMEVGLALDLDNSNLASIDAKYVFSTKYVKVGLACRF